ncbi:MAG: 2-keto-3-deoxy-6-phosphogluconate aldolase [Microbacterium sp.]|jgi:2-dehydro-3-deoxyphosphogluconate aldolase/(4S)-4-hydroxy-2-oxoglutarate aldolase|nr:2-keto-3-deoxy-6-phosphogluconate aldolase [Microbacterium sp.]
MTGELPARTLASKLVVVARASAASHYAPVLAALAEGGVQSVELTLTTPGTFDAFAALRSSFDGDLGIGTVTTLTQLDRAIEVGADYVVTPITSAALVERAVSAGIPIIPGGLTPTELFTSWAAGASAVKVFPAGQVGPGYLADLRGPFPDIAVVPSGGVDADGAASWLAAGAVAVSVGGPLLGDAFRGGDLGALRERAKRLVEVCGS